MKKIFAAILALCVLTSTFSLAFAESASLFPWGISCDEYISGYQLSDYETNQLNDYTTVLHMAYTDTDAEDLVFYNDQFVGTMYDYMGDSAARVDTLRQLLGSLVGETSDGGDERVFALMDIIVPGLYASAADFSECTYAVGADGTFGAVCCYKGAGYVLLIVNETLLTELHAANTASFPIGAGPIGSNIASGENVVAAATPAPTPAPSVSLGGNLTVGGGLTVGSGLTVESAPAADEEPADTATAAEAESYIDLKDFINNSGFSIDGNNTQTEDVTETEGLTIGGNLGSAVTAAANTGELVTAAGIDFPWGVGTGEYQEHVGIYDHETLDLGNGITGMYRYNSEDEYELCIFVHNQFVADILEFYSEEATNPDVLLERFEAMFGWYSAGDAAHVADIMNSMLPLGVTADDITNVYCAEMGGGVKAYSFLFDSCADIIVVNEMLLKSVMDN